MGSQGGGTQHTTSTTKVELSPEQREILSLAMPHIREFGATPPSLPPFSNIADFRPEQVAGQNYILGAAGAQAGSADAATGGHQFLMGDVLRPESNPGLQGHINAAVRPITEQLTESVLPNIRGGAIQAGQFGSSRQGIAEGMASREAARAIGDTTSKIVSENYGKGLDAMVKGLALTPAVQSAQLQPGISVSSVGDVRQMMDQAKLSEASQRFSYQELLPYMMGSEIAAMISAVPTAGMTSSGTTTMSGGGGFNPLQFLGLGLNLLGGLGGGGGGMGMLGLLPFLGSDRDMKTDIKQVGTLFDGTPVYRFRYKSGGPMMLGVMADEVNPAAVTEFGGRKVVDYSMVG